MSERLGRPDGPRIRDTAIRASDAVVLRRGARLVRVHPLAGPRALAWNELRSWGPTQSRFDHHTLPARHHPTRRIAYVTWGPNAFTAALAEYFQDEAAGVGPIDVSHRRPAVTVFELAAPLRLLDLDGGWVTRAGGNQAIRTGARSAARDWARSIYRHHPDVAGLAYGSSVWGPGSCAALWERAEHALPRSPLVTRTLDDPGLLPAVAASATALGTFLVG